MQDADQGERSEQNAAESKPQADATGSNFEIPGHMEILARLTTLELSLQQLRISVDSLAGNAGAVPSTLVSIIGAINTLTINVAYLLNLASVQNSTTAGLAVSAGNILHQGSMIYADTQMLRGCPPPPCWDTAVAATTATAFTAATSAGFADMSAPGETGNV